MILRSGAQCELALPLMISMFSDFPSIGREGENFSRILFPRQEVVFGFAPVSGWSLVFLAQSNVHGLSR